MIRIVYLSWRIECNGIVHKLFNAGEVKRPCVINVVSYYIKKVKFVKPKIVYTWKSIYQHNCSHQLSIKELLYIHFSFASDRQHKRKIWLSEAGFHSIPTLRKVSVIKDVYKYGLTSFINSLTNKLKYIF